MEKLLVTQREMSHTFYSFDNQIIIFVALRDICLQQNSTYSLIYLSDLSLHMNSFYFLPYFKFSYIIQMESRSMYMWFCSDDIDNWLKEGFIPLFFLPLPHP